MNSDLVYSQIEVLPTLGDNHCSLHAIFGEFDPVRNMIVDKAVFKRRRDLAAGIVTHTEVKDKTQPSDKQKRLRRLVRQSLESSLAGATFNFSDPVMGNLYRAYYKFIVEQEQLTKNLWSILSKELKKNPQLLKFVKENGKEIKKLQSQFTAAFNKNETGLKELLKQGSKELNQAFNDYQQPRASFNCESLLTPAIIRGYASELSGSKWLSPLELEMVAVIFDVDIIYYYDHEHPNAKPLYLSSCISNAPKAYIRFNGSNHYERVKVPDSPSQSPLGSLPLLKESKDEIKTVKTVDFQSPEITEKNLQILPGGDGSIIIKAINMSLTTFSEFSQALRIIYQDLLPDPLRIAVFPNLQIKLSGLTKFQEAELEYLIKLFFNKDSISFQSSREKKISELSEEKQLRKWLADFLIEWRRFKPKEDRAFTFLVDQPFPDLTSLRDYLFNQLIRDPRFSIVFRAEFSSLLPEAKTRIEAQTMMTSSSPETYIGCMVGLPDGRVARGGSGGILRIHHPSQELDIKVMTNGKEAILSLAVLGNYLAIGCSGNRFNLSLLDISDQFSKRIDLDGHTGSVCKLVSLPPDRLISSSDDKTIRLWDIPRKKCLRVINDKSICGAFIRAIVALPEGNRLASTFRTSIMLWSLADDLNIQELKGHKGPVTALAMLPNGYLVSGSDDKTIRIWDLQTGKCVKILTGHTGEIDSIAVFADGMIASCSSRDKTIRLWNSSQETPVETIDNVDIHRLAILPGAILAGSTDNGVIYKWYYPHPIQKLEVNLYFLKELRQKDLQVLSSKEGSLVLKTRAPCGTAFEDFKKTLSALYQDLSELKIILPSFQQMEIRGLSERQRSELEYVFKFIFRKQKALPGACIEEIVTERLDRVEVIETKTIPSVGDVTAQLVTACEAGDLKTVEKVLKPGTQLKLPEDVAKLLLCSSVYSTNPALIEWLISFINQGKSKTSTMSWGRQIDSTSNRYYPRIWKNSHLDDIAKVTIISLFQP